MAPIGPRFLCFLIFLGSAPCLSQSQRLSLKPSKENCRKVFGESAYLSEEGRRKGTCVLKVDTPMTLPTEVQDSHGYGGDGSFFTCPLNSGYSWNSWSGAECTCNRPYHPSPDNRTCLIGTKGQGEFCEADPKDCNGLMGLVCMKGKCGCEEEAVWSRNFSRCFSNQLCKHWGSGSRTKYDAEAGICIGHADDSCDLEIGLGCPGTSVCQPKPTSTWSTGHGYTGQCTCPEGTTKSRDGISCMPLLLLGDACQLLPKAQKEEGPTVDPCSPAAKLSCIDEICACPPGSAWQRDSASAVCVLQPDQVCDSGFYEDRLNCGSGSVCYGYGSYSQCKCRPGYQVSPEDGLCYGDYGLSCHGDSACGGGMICLDGACACAHPLQQTYASFWGQEPKRCLGLVGSSCADTAPCVTGSHCYNGTCKCIPQTSPTLAATCLMSHGSHCMEKMCNFDEGLGCLRGTCQCIDDTAEYVEGLGCVLSALGGICGEVGSVGACHTSGFDEKVNRDCVLDKYRIGCKEPLVCSPAGGGKAMRCLSGTDTEGYARWVSKYRASQAEAEAEGS